MDSQDKILTKEEIKNMQQTIAQSWVEEGIEIGLEKGRKEGREEGREEGRINALHAMVDRLGRKRFGLPSEQVTIALHAILDVGRIEAMIDRIADVTSWDELLNSNPSR